MKTKERDENIRKAWKLKKEENPRIVRIKCGKENCTKCPHGPYLYVRIKTSKGHIDKYKGKCNSNGLPRE